MSDRNITHKSNRTESYSDRQFRYQLTKLCNTSNVHDRYLTELIIHKCLEDLINFKNSEIMLRIYSILMWCIALEQKKMVLSFRIPKDEIVTALRNKNWYIAQFNLKNEFLHYRYNNAKIWLENMIVCDQIDGNCSYNISKVKYKAIQFAKTYFISPTFDINDFNDLREQYLND